MSAMAIPGESNVVRCSECESSISLNTFPFVHLQVFSSPPGTVLVAYVVSASGSSRNEITFWNGNSTDQTDVLSVRDPGETHRRWIVSSSNVMTIRAERPYAWYTFDFTLLISVQKGTMPGWYLVVYQVTLEGGFLDVAHVAHVFLEHNTSNTNSDYFTDIIRFVVLFASLKVLVR